MKLNPQRGVGGGAEGNRTPDLVIANDALSQLSYSPTRGAGLGTGTAERFAQAGVSVKLPFPLASAPRIRDNRPKPGAAQRMILDALFFLVQAGLNLFFWAVILAAVLSLLVGFGVLDTRNRLVWTLSDFFYRVTEPVLRPVRNRLPNLGGIDLSPLVVLLLIQAAMLLVAAIRGYMLRAGIYF